MRLILLTFSAVLVSPIVNGQTFESATIKPSVNSPGIHYTHGEPPGTVQLRHFSLRSLLATAFGVEEAQIAGPSRLDTDRYDIDARALPGSTPDQVRMMEQNLLKTHFEVVSHIEKRTVEAYLLVVAPAGEKLKPASDDSQTMGIGTVCQKCSLVKFAGMLSQRLYKPVVDATGIEGKFNFQVRLPSVPEPAPAPAFSAAMPNSPVGRNSIDSSDIAFQNRGITLWQANPPGSAKNYRDVSAALENQLGLKLEKSKTPVDMLVIDHIENHPTN